MSWAHVDGSNAVSYGEIAAVLHSRLGPEVDTCGPIRETKPTRDLSNPCRRCMRSLPDIPSGSCAGEAYQIQQAVLFQRISLERHHQFWAGRTATIFSTPPRLLYYPEQVVGARQLVGEALDSARGIPNLPASSATGFLTWVWLDLAEQYSAQHTLALPHATANFPATPCRGLRQQPRPDLQRSVSGRGKCGRGVGAEWFHQRSSDNLRDRIELSRRCYH